MSIHDRLLPNFALQIIPIREFVHEEVLCEYSWAEGLFQDIESFLPVWVSVGEVGSDSFVWEVFYCSIIETGSKAVRFCLPLTGIARPTCRFHPLWSVAGGVDVDADEDDVGFAEGGAVGVDAADTFFEGDVFGFRNQEFGVVASGLEDWDDSSCEFSGVGVFEELAVRGAFAFGLDAVTVVD